MTTTTQTASEIRTLTQATTFRRSSPKGDVTLTLPKGERYRYSRRETPTQVIHLATVTRDGFVWTNEQRRDKPVVTAPTASQAKSAPVQAQLDATASANSSAVEAIAGRQVKGVDASMRRVRQLDKAFKACTGRLFLVNYYHPTVLNIKSPARIFARHGYQLDGSNYLFTEEGLNHPEVQAELRSWDAMKPIVEDSGVEDYTITIAPEYWETEYTVEQRDMMKARIQKKLGNELLSLHKAMIARIDEAARDIQALRDALPEDATEQDEARLNDKENTRLRSAVRDTFAAFESCLRGAEIFDDTGNLDAIEVATKAAIRASAQAVNLTLAQRGVKQVEIPDSIAD